MSVLPCFFEHPILPEPNDIHHLNFRGIAEVALLGSLLRNTAFKHLDFAQEMWGSLFHQWSAFDPDVFRCKGGGLGSLRLPGLVLLSSVWQSCPKLQNRSRLLLISFGEKVLGESHCTRQLNMSFSIPSGRNIRGSQQLGIKKRRDEKPTMLRLRLEFGLNRGLIPEVGQGDLLSRACVHGLNVENETKSIVEQLGMIHRIGSLEALLYRFPFPSYFEQVHKIMHQFGRLSEI